MRTNALTRTSEPTPPARKIDVELLALDLDVCTRCVGTLTNIEKAIETVQEVLDTTGFEVIVHKTLIKSEEQAHQHRFVASPTIRINGRDITPETLESHCDSCTDLCGCGEGTSCRMWRYRGQEYTEAPVGLVVEAMLREIHSDDTQAVSEPAAYESVPANLQRFFASRASSCCAPAEQEVCCEPPAKTPCCGTVETKTCGCQ